MRSRGQSKRWHWRSFHEYNQKKFWNPITKIFINILIFFSRVVSIYWEQHIVDCPKCFIHLISFNFPVHAISSPCVARMIAKGNGKDSPQINFCHYQIDFLLLLNLQLFGLIHQTVWLVSWASYGHTPWPGHCRPFTFYLVCDVEPANDSEAYSFLFKVHRTI